MATLFDFEVHTPYRRFFSGEVEAIVLILADGEIGVYAHHSPFTAPAETCVLRIKDEHGEWRNAFIARGILEVKDHKTVLIAASAEWPEEIDRERALHEEKEAQEKLEAAMTKYEIQHSKHSLRRAQYRLRVAEMQNTNNQQK